VMSNGSNSDVRIPSKAVSDGTDVRAPAEALLRGLNLLPKEGELKDADGLGAVLHGPPQSVALIEAGATAAAKWWATGLGVSVLAAWGSLVAWWDVQDDSIKVAALIAAAVITAAVTLSVGYLVASDVSGRAAAQVATIEARVRIATTFASAAQEVYAPPRPTAAEPTLVPLPPNMLVRNTQQSGSDEDDWLAIAMERYPDGKHKYILVKDKFQETVPVDKVEIQSVSEREEEQQPSPWKSRG
jgi:hypothetical protein